MMRQRLLFFFVLNFSFAAAQETDSVALISEVRLDAYKKPTSVLASTKSAGVISPELLNQNSPERLLEAINQNPGSRMEERSPGSYRIAVRGSSLRSPFGVRNVKIYLDDFILSDASGNMYLNVLAPQLISRIEVYKGPDSGDFGAETGGTLLLKTRSSEHLSAAFSAGSYGTFNENVDWAAQKGKHFFQFFQSYYRSDSYRDQSAISRRQVFLKDHFQYRQNAQLKAMLLLADLQYETPGGLTFEQMQQDRRQARPATSKLPGAAEQQAGIRNRMLLAGISHEVDFSPSFSHFLMVQGSYVDFKNPFITNFENRFENNLALRTHLNFAKELEKSSLEWRVGFEGARSSVFIKNFDNNRGEKGAPQNFDQLENTAGFFFVSQKFNYAGKLFSDISLSLNSNSYDWERLFPTTEKGSQKFSDRFLPNFGVTWLLDRGFSLRAKVGKGLSAPTNEEIRSSSQAFNLGLQPEYGWNKEVGVRKQVGRILFAEASYFDFRLKDAIVRRQNEAGQEYFVNQGSTIQKGLELLAETKNFRWESNFLSGLKFRISGSFYRFTFEDYRQKENDFSGNEISGVPRTTVSTLLQLQLFKKLGVEVAHFYTSKMPLNDANSVWAEESFIGNLQLRYPLFLRAAKVNLHLQIQNLYDSDYVLGYDINAFGNRFYNPAAKRNVTAGITVDF